jgi:hypothetical protein
MKSGLQTQLVSILNESTGSCGTVPTRATGLLHLFGDDYTMLGVHAGHQYLLVLLSMQLASLPIIRGGYEVFWKLCAPLYQSPVLTLYASVLNNKRNLHTDHTVHIQICIA